MRVCMFVLVLFAACQGKEDPAAPETWPELPTTTCGTEAYDWLPLEGMGQILAWEKVEEWSLPAATIDSLMGLAGFAGGFRAKNGVQTWRVRYSTQDRGAPAEATGLLVFPDLADASPDLVLWLHGTTGLEDFCAPSGRDLLWAGPPIAIASQGFAVAAPDYLGQNGFGAEAEDLHPFLIAEPTAVASLDMLRALHRFADAGLDPSLRVTPTWRAAIWGASEGGFAALWSERYAAAWLPELEVVTTVMVVPPLELVDWATRGAQELSVASVGVPLTLAAMRDWYRVSAPMSEVVTADYLDDLETAINEDCPEAELPADLGSLDALYTDAWMENVGSEDAETWAPWSCMLRENSLSTAPIPRGAEVPALMILGGEDDVVLTASGELAWQTLCDQGHPVWAVECLGLGHIDASVESLPAQLSWVDARLRGEAIAGEACASIVAADCAALPRPRSVFR